MSDLLREAAHALRDEGGEPADRAQATRARVMLSLHARRQRRTRVATIFVPLAALLAGSTAWAAASGGLPGVWKALSTVVEAVAPSEPSPSGPRAGERRRGETASVEEPASVAIEAPPRDIVTEQSAPEPKVPESPVVREAPHAPAPPEASDAPGVREDPVAPPEPKVPATKSRAASGSEAPPKPAAEDALLELYRVAHRAHFVDQNPTRALGAWEAYLSAAPDGQFAPEARYNRALTLVRLGRYDAARAALEPFARGAFGTYRQREASALLEELDSTQ